MRRAYDGKVWRDDQLNIIAVNLGADFCAEHEWGVSGIKDRLGISNQKPGVINALIGKEKIGIDSRKITKGGDEVLSFTTEIEVGSGRNKKKKQMFGLGLTNRYRMSNEDPARDFDHYVKSVYFDAEKEEIAAFWSESRFMFITESDRDVNDLLEAFKNNDIAIWVGASGPFRNGGLTIAIVSRLPKDFTDGMLQADQDYLDLKKAADSTGIHKILENAGKRFYALSPRWKDESKKEVVFWLNPQEQHIHNFGWYGVDELKQWAKDEGPIIKTKQKA